jgi:uncharacterized protein YbaR (Trm112 family)
MQEEIAAREKVVERLQQDLVGPRAHDEVLSARPSDVYLTGILWPRNTFVAPEENERLAVAGESEDGEDSDEALPSTVAMHRPSTAGISLAAAVGGPGPAEVTATVQFAIYHRHEKDHVVSWRRELVSCEPVTLALSHGNHNQHLVLDSITGLRLNVHATGFSGGTLATVTLVNDATPQEYGRDAIEQLTIFQVSLSITASADTRLIARPSRQAIVDDDDKSGALLYRKAREFAVGHTCSASWTVAPDSPQTIRTVEITWLPELVTSAVSADGHEVFRNIGDTLCQPLSAEWLSSASDKALSKGLMKLCDAYSRWIDLQENDTDKLTEDETDVAERHLRECNNVLDRMRNGAARMASDQNVADAFRLANLAMNTQRQWSRGESLTWRPFQLGFLLLALESSADNDHPDRNVMDLLWFPTGGGKTEAYLALIAFIAFHRRISRTDPDDGAGVACIMRYTLRLLTTQQFIRATAMITACEAIRRGHIAAGTHVRLGTIPFSIGLWVGGDATPNKRKDAFAAITDRSKSSARQITACPCCKTKLVYRQQTASDHVTVYCIADGCVLNDSLPLPVWTVDEDIYDARPTLLIGTVDKFAQIVRKQATAALFGVGSAAQPQLILQDELHLISGPLGTIVGLYETAIDLILSANGSRPKIIGSTATIRRAADQVLALFDRETCQFPPPGLDAADSGFAVVNPDVAGRKYVGVSTVGRSAKFTLQAVAASILQSASAAAEGHRDDYWTLVAYFNSLRELGGALVLMQDDVHDSLKLLAQWRNEDVRSAIEIEELTSRRTQEEVRDMLEKLEIPAANGGAVDAVLATNMLSVGVDIARLGVMLVNGQPKTMAEYIQSTSRVGRSEVPGLVVPVLNNAKPRDRSHFETFRTWHSMLYRSVEATSVTPFASRARDRALHVVLVAAVRHLIPTMNTLPVIDDDQVLDEILAIIDRISERAHRIDPLETSVTAELRKRLNVWRMRSPEHYWKSGRQKGESLLQSAEIVATRRAAGLPIGQAWPTPNSMRGIEPSTPYRLAEGLRRPV